MDREIERLKAAVEDGDFQYTVVQKERDMLKEQMFSIDENFAKAREETKRLQNENTKLDIIVLQCRSKAEEDD